MDTLGTEVYRWVLGGEACDRCQPQAGLHPSRPTVPLHSGCDCTVQPVQGQDAECTYELRSLAIWETRFSELAGQDFANCEPGLASVVPDVPVPSPYWAYDAGVEQAAQDQGWSPPDYVSGPGNILVDPCTMGEVQAEIVMYQAMFKAERWAICRARRPEGTEEVSERMVGVAGGGFSAAVEVKLSLQNVEPCADCQAEPDFQDLFDFLDEHVGDPEEDGGQNGGTL